jgi:transcriptional regulator with XRE-family HTH domain
MYTKERLVRGEGYWMETIQQTIYEALLAYMDKHDLNKTELATKLGFTRGYVSQLMNGNFNLSQKKIIQLLLKLDMVPDLLIRTVDEYLASSKGAKADRAAKKPALKASKMAAASMQRAVRQGAKRAVK